MTCLAQEQESTKERLISAGADYERQEEKYNCEIERLQEKLNKVNNNNNKAVHWRVQNSTMGALHIASDTVHYWTIQVAVLILNNLCFTVNTNKINNLLLYSIWRADMY